MARTNYTPRQVYVAGKLSVEAGYVSLYALSSSQIFPTPLECHQWIEEQGYNDNKYRVVVMPLKVKKIQA